jgi:hypothetical protein
MPIAELLLMTNLAATWFMVGLIWFVQLVHYPQFAGIGAGEFRAAHARHTRFTTYVVGPPMLVEGVTALALLVLRPAPVSAWTAWAGATLVGVIWMSTAFLQVPCHNRLASEFDKDRCGQLVKGNWVRTVAWTTRGLLMLWAALRVLTS